MAKTPKKPRQYEYTKSPFFRLESKRTLLAKLAISPDAMDRLLTFPAHEKYKMFHDKVSGRYITEPIGELKLIHQRIAKLLCRIKPPIFLQSATKRRSYKTNAEAHLGSGKIIKLDIKNYYPSITFGAIYEFFLKKMMCSIDVATILSKLCTVTALGKTHLPTGSCLSPILSYWAHCDLFEGINQLCVSQGCKMTLYIDDITVSGANANKDLLNKIQDLIRHTGLVAHKQKTYDNEPATVTGVIVSGKQIALPHKRAKSIRELRDQLKTAPDDAAEVTLAKLIGKLNEAQQFVAAYGAVKSSLLATHAMMWRRITDDRAARSRAMSARRKRKR